MDFENVFNQICSNMGSSDVKESSRLFSQCDSDMKRILFVSQLEAVNQQMDQLCLAIDNVSCCKSTEQASNLRNQGNNYFQKKKNVDALKYYNQSILLSPANSQGNELSLAMANRSAVLYDMNEWMLCLRDIAMAFMCAYPLNLRYKLYERQGNCHLKLGNRKEASESFQMAVSSLQHVNTDQEKLSKLVANLEFKLNSLTNCNQDERIVKKMTIEAIEQEIFNQRELPPQLNKEINPLLPCASMSIKIAESTDKGRHLLATENLEPGTTIIVEKAFTSILLSDKKETHCHHCLNWTIAPIPCPNCPQVRFCSVTCRDKARESYHSVECGLSDFLDAANVGKHGLLALRTAAQVGCRTLMDMAAEATDLLAQRQAVVYDSNAYRTIYNLIANTAQRSVADLFRRTVMALYLAHVLKHRGFLVNGDDGSNQLLTVASILLRHLQNYPCNAHEVSQLCVPNVNVASSNLNMLDRLSDLNLTGRPAPATVRQAHLSEVGAAAFGCLSLINHSCDPNVVRHCYGNVAVVTTIRSVGAGQEILDNYGYHYATHPLTERQNKLSSQYHFRCLCSACTQQWPLYGAIDDRLRLAPCRSSRKCAQHSCSNCLQSRTDLQTSSAMFQTQLEILMALPCRQSEPGRWMAMGRIFSRHIKCLDDNALLPTRQYNEAQEALKQCLALSSTVYFESDCCA